MATKSSLSYFKPSVQTGVSKEVSLGGFVKPGITEEVGVSSTGTGGYSVASGTTRYSGGSGGGGMSVAGGTPLIESKQAEPPKPPVSTKGYEIKSVGGEPLPKTTTKTVEQQIQGVGSEKVTYELAWKSLQEKGYKGYPRQSDIELEFYNLTNKARTPGQKERTTTVTQVGLAGVTAFTAPLAIPGFFGATIGGLAAGAGTMIGAPFVTKTGYDILIPSELSDEERKKAAQAVDKALQTRVQEEGVNIPLLTPEQEKQIGGFQVPLIGSVGGLIYELPGGRATTLPKAEQEYTKYFEEQGFSKEDAVRKAKIETGREFGAGSLGEGIGMVAGAQAIGEISGRATQKGISIVSKVGEKTLTPRVAQVYGLVSGAIGGGIGGMIETAAGYPAFMSGRYRDYTSSDYAKAIATGGLSAGIIGGVIGAATGKSTLQKRLYGIASAAEGFQEYGGDIAADKYVGKALDVSLNIAGTSTKVGTKSGASSIAISATENLKNKLGGMNIVDIGTYQPSKSEANLIEQSLQNQLNQDVKTNVPMTTRVQSIEITPSPGTTRTQTGTNTPISPETINPNPITPNPITPNIPTPVEPVTPIKQQEEQIIENITSTTTYTPTIVPTMVPTITARGMPFIPPIGLGSAGLGGKQTRREKSRFIDEFSAAFAGLATPGTPVYFGKQKPITIARRISKPKKPRKPKQISFKPSGGFNFGSIFA